MDFMKNTLFIIQIIKYNFFLFTPFIQLFKTWQKIKCKSCQTIEDVVF